MGADGTAAQGPAASTFVEIPSTAHYWVEVQAGSEGCEHCHAGAMYTIVSGEGGEQTEISTAWGDRELAEDVCDLMNMAYEAGKEAPEPFSHPVPPPWEPCRLVPNCTLRKGHEGDCDDIPF